jgi:hypothetical protein
MIAMPHAIADPAASCGAPFDDVIVSSNMPPAAMALNSEMIQNGILIRFVF